MKKELIEDLGRVLTRMRKKKLMSQVALGAATDTSQMTIQRIESGNGGGVRLETLFNIADALKISLADLFIELERDGTESYDLSCAAKFENLMKKMSPPKKEWISDIALKIIENQFEES